MMNKAYVPRHQRGDWENYGQVESHVQQVYNGTMGWFGNDVYDINPLSENGEAARTVQMMGGHAAVQEAVVSANAQGGFANWRWTLKLTSLLLELDPAKAEARKLGAAAARHLGQRTPTAQALAAASVDENLQFVRYLVDPRKAEDQHLSFTLAVGDGSAEPARPRVRSQPPDAPRDGGVRTEGNEGAARALKLLDFEIVE